MVKNIYIKNKINSKNTNVRKVKIWDAGQFIPDWRFSSATALNPYYAEPE